jgi:hypothetical protein
VFVCLFGWFFVAFFVFFSVFVLCLVCPMFSVFTGLSSLDCPFRLSLTCFFIIYKL